MGRFSRRCRPSAREKRLELPSAATMTGALNMTSRSAPAGRAMTPTTRPDPPSIDRLRGGRLLVQRDAELLGAPGEDLVEVEPGSDEPVVGEAGQLGPRQLDPHAARQDPQPLVLQPAGLGAGVDAELDELVHRARREAVAADLLARKRGLLEERHDKPACARCAAVADPAGPAPTTMTSASVVGVPAGMEPAALSTQGCGTAIGCLACHGFTT